MHPPDPPPPTDRPRRRTFVPRDEVLAAFATAPVLDPDHFRRDLDAAVDRDLSDRVW